MIVRWWIRIINHSCFLSNIENHKLGSKFPSNLLFHKGYHECSS